MFLNFNPLAQGLSYVESLPSSLIDQATTYIEDAVPDAAMEFCETSMQHAVAAYRGAAQFLGRGRDAIDFLMPQTRIIRDNPFHLEHPVQVVEKVAFLDTLTPEMRFYASAIAGGAAVLYLGYRLITHPWGSKKDGAEEEDVLTGDPIILGTQPVRDMEMNNLFAEIFDLSQPHIVQSRDAALVTERETLTELRSKLFASGVTLWSRQDAVNKMLPVVNALRKRFEPKLGVDSGVVNRGREVLAEIELRLKIAQRNLRQLQSAYKQVRYFRIELFDKNETDLEHPRQILRAIDLVDAVVAKLTGIVLSRNEFSQTETSELDSALAMAYDLLGTFTPSHENETRVVSVMRSQIGMLRETLFGVKRPESVNWDEVRVRVNFTSDSIARKMGALLQDPRIIAIKEKETDLEVDKIPGTTDLATAARTMREYIDGRDHDVDRFLYEYLRYVQHLLDPLYDFLRTQLGVEARNESGLGDEGLIAYRDLLIQVGDIYGDLTMMMEYVFISSGDVSQGVLVSLAEGDEFTVISPPVSETAPTLMGDADDEPATRGVAAVVTVAEETTVGDGMPSLSEMFTGSRAGLGGRTRKPK